MNFAVSIGTDEIVQGFGLPAAIVIIALVVALIYVYKDGQRQRDLRVTDAKEFSNKIATTLDSMQANIQRQAETSEKIYGRLIDGRRK